MELWTAFLLGLGGSLHCLGMCGPLLLALPPGTGNVGTQVVRRGCYHAGRVLTYGCLGGLSGSMGGVLGLAESQRWVSVAAGVVILLGLLAWPARLSQKLAAFPMGWLKRAFGGLLAAPTLAAQFPLGIVNGLLPCGLVYVATVAASASGGALAGFRFMLAFGVGTLPMLMAVTFAGAALHGWFRSRLRLWVPCSFAVMAGLLILRGLALGIPFLSPQGIARVVAMINTGLSRLPRTCRPGPTR